MAVVTMTVVTTTDSGDVDELEATVEMVMVLHGAGGVARTSSPIPVVVVSVVEAISVDAADRRVWICQTADGDRNRIWLSVGSVGKPHMTVPTIRP